MPNSISKDQNSARQLARLAAQSQLYSEAKRLVTLQTLLALPIPLAWSAAIAVLPWLDIYGAFWGLTASLFEAIVLDPWQESRKRQGARTQELFDCDVLQIRWNSLIADKPPDPEIVARCAAIYQKTHPTDAPLRDWYPPAVSGLSLQLARLICQRANLWWEGELRQRYRICLLSAVAIVITTVTFIGIAGDLTVRKLFLAVLAPLSPALVFTISRTRREAETLAAVQRFKAYIQSLWGKALRGEVSDREADLESRRLQDVIFQHRERATLIFDWFYRIFRKQYGLEMNKAARELLEQATHAIHPSA